MAIGNAGRPCTICTSKSRHTADARLAAGEPYRRVAIALGLSESALKRHKRAGHVAEAERAATSATERAREINERIREHDAHLATLSFEGDLKQQAEALRDHAVALLRRSEAGGDVRSAIAAGSLIEKSLATLTMMMARGAAGGEAETAPRVIIYPQGWELPDWLVQQLPCITCWLPDNGRGDGTGSRQVPAEELSQGAILPCDADLAG